MEFGRVNQLDAMLLDNFYQDKIIEKLLKGFPYDQPKRFLASVLVKSLYLYSGLWKNRTTEGNAIYNVNYASKGRWFLALHYLSEIFGTLVECFEEKIGFLATIWNFFILVNWGLFLAGGKYRNLPERIGRVLVPLQSPKKALNIDYFYTKRAAFFQVLSDTAKVILPEIQIERILGFFNSEANILADSGDACVVCGEEDMVSPVRFNDCVHSGCYYCFVSANRQCPQCK